MISDELFREIDNQIHSNIVCIDEKEEKINFLESVYYICCYNIRDCINY
jgi:hypothetical protein